MPKGRKLKVVLDANWFISACINSRSRRTIYYKILSNAQLRVFYSSELVAEFEGVISRKKFAKIITPVQVGRFQTLALPLMNRIVSTPIPATSRDPDDDYLLGICKTCQADFLITGDDDLLTLGTFEHTTIVSMGQFLQILSLL